MLHKTKTIFALLWFIVIMKWVPVETRIPSSHFWWRIVGRPPSMYSGASLHHSIWRNKNICIDAASNYSCKRTSRKIAINPDENIHSLCPLLTFDYARNTFSPVIACRKRRMQDIDFIRYDLCKCICINKIKSVNTHFVYAKRTDNCYSRLDLQKIYWYTADKCSIHGT